MTEYASECGVDLDMIHDWNKYNVPYSDFNNFISPKKLKIKLKLNKLQYNNNSDPHTHEIPHYNTSTLHNNNIPHSQSVVNKKRTFNMSKTNDKSITPPMKKIKVNPIITKNETTRDKFATVTTNINNNINNNINTDTTHTNSSDTNPPILLINPESIEMPTFGHVSTVCIYIRHLRMTFN